MQNMHKSTHDRPLTGVHWPITTIVGNGSAYRPGFCLVVSLCPTPLYNKGNQKSITFINL